MHARANRFQVGFAVLLTPEMDLLRVRVREVLEKDLACAYRDVVAFLVPLTNAPPFNLEHRVA